jgi:hypothetical protein
MPPSQAYVTHLQKLVKVSIVHDGNLRMTIL